MLTKLQNGQKCFIIRYGKQIVPDCIRRHREKIDEIGYCWFGKLGSAPVKNKIEAVLESENPTIILYARNDSFICRIEDVAYEKPADGYPEYYDTELYAKYSFPTIYFKITQIEPLDMDALKNFIVVSSKSDAVSTLNRSMSSFLFVSYGSDNQISKEVNKKPKEYKVKKILSVNECYYRKNGICLLRGFVNYQYECEHPSRCIRQKR